MNTRRRIDLAFALALGCAACLSPALARAETETLADALVSAYRNSDLLEQRRALLRAADEDLAQAEAKLQPVVNFVANASGNSRGTSSLLRGSDWSKTASLSASLTLYDHGRSRHAEDVSRETILGLRSALRQIEQRVLLDAAEAYMDVIRATQFVSLRNNNVGLISEELRAAQDRFRIGDVTRTDVSIAEARLASARGNLAAAEGELDVARETYKVAVGHYPGELRWPDAPPAGAATEAEAMAAAVRGHPSISEARHNISVAEGNVRRAEAALGPTLTGSASLDVADAPGSDIDDYATLGLRLTVPIYSGGTLRSAIRAAAENRDASRSRLLQVVAEVERDAGIAWSNQAVAIARTEASRLQVDASEIAFQGVRDEATLGARSTLDVLDAEQDLLDARSNLLGAEVQQYVSRYALLSAMGRLTPEGLNLGIPDYDPAEFYRYAPPRGGERASSPEGRALERVLRALNR